VGSEQLVFWMARGGAVPSFDLPMPKENLLKRIKELFAWLGTGMTEPLLNEFIAACSQID
jgi:hypothetical protein